MRERLIQAALDGQLEWGSELLVGAVEGLPIVAGAELDEIE